MPELKKQIKTALIESRMLTLPAQVLLGFTYRGAFQEGFEKLPDAARFAKVGTLACLIVTLGCLCAPTAFHRIVEGVGETRRLHRFTNRMLEGALAPFAVALGSSLFVATSGLLGPGAAAVFGGAVLALALALWFGVRVLRTPHAEHRKGNEVAETSLEEKIDHALIEARLVLPGAQALLGFQLVTPLTEPFAQMPDAAKVAHLVSMGFIALTVVLLVSPAAFHRVVERGDSTERLLRYTGFINLSALATLAMGIALDVHVVVWRVLGWWPAGAIGGALTLIFCYGLWFGYTLWRRAADRREAMRPEALV